MRSFLCCFHILVKLQWFGWGNFQLLPFPFHLDLLFLSFQLFLICTVLFYHSSFSSVCHLVLGGSPMRTCGNQSVLKTYWLLKYAKPLPVLATVLKLNCHDFQRILFSLCGALLSSGPSNTPLLLFFPAQTPRRYRSCDY